MQKYLSISKVSAKIAGEFRKNLCFVSSKKYEWIWKKPNNENYLKEYERTWKIMKEYEKI